MLDQTYPLLHIANTVHPVPGHRLLFVFDALMDEARIRELCPDTRFVMTARLMSRRLIFSKAGTATIAPERGHEVHGVIWETAEANLGRLDSHMFKVGAHARRGALARGSDGRVIAAEHYWTRDRHSYEPDAHELLRIVELAKRLGFPIPYIQEMIRSLGQLIH